MDQLALTAAATCSPADDLQEAYSQHRDVVARFVARQTSDPTTVDDCVQDVFERLMRSGVPGPIGSWRALLLRVARSVLVDRARRQQARRAALHAPLELAGPLEDPTPFVDIIIARDRLARLKVAVLALDPLERDIVLLARIEGLSHKAIANRLGIDPVRVSRILYRTIARLAAQIGEA